MNSYRKEQLLSKPLPSSEEAERAILGGILLDPRLITQASMHLNSSDFYHTAHSAVFVAMSELMRRGRPIDPITISEELKRTDSLDGIGGSAIVANLTFGLPHFTNISEYVNIVRDNSLARRVVKECNQIMENAIGGDIPIAEVLARASTMLTALQSVADESDDMASVAEHLATTFTEWETGNTLISSLQTGIPELDQRLQLQGIAYGELTIIAARPSCGKTAMLLQILSHIARLGVPILFVSLEMLKEKLVSRMLPAIAGVPNKSISPKTMRSVPGHREKLMKALDTIKDLPIFFDRSFAIDKLIAKANYYVETKGVRLVVFDYLTLIHGNNKVNRDSEVGRITEALKEFAVRTNTAVLGAAQFNRDPGKEVRRPKPEDLRDSGVIEQVVDTLLFPWDPAVKENQKNPELVTDGLWLDLYCAKQRDGESGWSIPLYYDKNLQTFESQTMRGEIAPRNKPVVPTAQPVKSFHEKDDEDRGPF